MNVSCRATRLLVEALTARGSDVTSLASRVGFSPEHLTDVRRKIDWDAFALLHEKVAEELGGYAAMEDLGVVMVRTEGYGVLRRAAGHVFSPHQLHVIGAKWFAPALFPDLSIDVVAADERHVRLRWVLPSHLRGARAFFHVCRGTMIGLTTLLGLPPSIVEGPVESHRAEWTVLLPAQRKGVRQLLRRARAAIAGVQLFDELASAQHEINETYAALLRSKRDFRALLESAPMAIAIHRDGRYVWANPALARMLGWESADQLVGRDLFEDAHEGDRAAIAARMITPTEQTVPAEFRIRRRDGSFAVFEVAATQATVFDGARPRACSWRTR